MAEEYKICSACGDIIDYGTPTEILGNILCPGCAETLEVNDK